MSFSTRNTLLVAAALLIPSVLCAQERGAAEAVPFQVAVTYGVQHSNLTTGPYFWMQGEGVELSGPIDGGFGLAMDFSRQDIADIRHTGTDLTLLTTTIGPQYTWSPALFGQSDKRLDLFGEALVGASDAHGSLYSTESGLASRTDSFALQAGGGLDFAFSRHWAVRALQVDWVRTRFPNGTTGVQDSLRLSTGVVFRFGVDRGASATIVARPTSSMTLSAAPPAAATLLPAATPDGRPGEGAGSINGCAGAARRGAGDPGCTLEEEIDVPGVGFATDSAELTSDSADALSREAAALRDRPAVALEIQGYTDSRGSDQHNLLLSQRRAETVKRYLQDQGIANSMTAKGYGKGHPAADNSTADGRLHNRRVVLLILSGS